MATNEERKESNTTPQKRIPNTQVQNPMKSVQTKPLPTKMIYFNRQNGNGKKDDSTK